MGLIVNLNEFLKFSSVHAVIQKPFRSVDLVETVNRVLLAESKTTPAIPSMHNIPV